MTRAVTLLTTIALSCAAAPSTPTPPGTNPKATEVKGPQMPTASSPPMVPPDVKKVSPPDLSGKVEPMPVAGAERVALIWGYPSCTARPWIVSVVDLGSRTVTVRALSSGSELELYAPPPAGGCVKGACPTMSVVMPSQSPSLFSGTGTMPGGMGKGRYTVSPSTACPEPLMVPDADLLDWAARLVTARNEAQAAIAALRASGR
jgi:hypothetical protein